MSAKYKIGRRVVMTSSSSPRRLLLNACIAVGFALAAGWAIDGMRSSSQAVGAVSLSVIRGEFARVPIPPSHVRVDRLLIVDHGGPIGVAQNFRAPESADVIVGYYKSQLPRLGWALVDYRKISPREDSIKFCKGSLSLSIDAMREIGSIKYYIAILWTSNRDDDAYCKNS